MPVTAPVTGLMPSTPLPWLVVTYTVPSGPTVSWPSHALLRSARVEVAPVAISVRRR